MGTYFVEICDHLIHIVQSNQPEHFENKQKTNETIFSHFPVNRARQHHTALLHPTSYGVKDTATTKARLNRYPSRL